MAGKELKLGDTSRAVAANIQAHRKAAGWGLTDLSKQLKAVGREIPPNGLANLEAVKRRVDVDDLMAFAVVFGVDPNDLLGYRSVSASETGKGTDAERARAELRGSMVKVGDRLEELQAAGLSEDMAKVALVEEVSALLGFHTEASAIVTRPQVKVFSPPGVPTLAARPIITRTTPPEDGADA